MHHVNRALLSLWVLLAFGVTAHAATVTLQWDRNPEADVTGYIVSYGTASRTYTVSTNVGNQTSVTVTLTPAGTRTYYFAVQAYSPAGTSAYSAEVSAVVSNPLTRLTIDRPVSGSGSHADLLLTGWAADEAATSGTGVDTLHVYAYPNPGSGAAPIFVGVAAYGDSRPDVAAVLGSSRFTNSGFSLPIVGLTPGPWELAVFARSTVTGEFSAARTVRIDVWGPTSTPEPRGAHGVIDLPGLGSRVTGWLSIGGWALDRRASRGSGIDVVQVWAYPAPGSGSAPIFLGNAAYGRARPDVASIFGSRFSASGFHLDVAGLPSNLYDIVILGRSTASRAFDVARVTRVHVDPSMSITVDTPSFSASVPSSFTISGWALDRRGSTDNGVDALHVYAYPNPGSDAGPIFLGVAATGLHRADVAAAYGSQFRYSGFSLPVSGLAPGPYEIVIFGHSTISGSFDNARVLRLTVQ